MTTTIKGKTYTFKVLDFLGYAEGRKLGFRFDAAIKAFQEAGDDESVDAATTLLKQAWDSMVTFAIEGDATGLEFKGTRLEDMKGFFQDFAIAALGTTPKSNAA